MKLDTLHYLMDNSDKGDSLMNHYVNRIEEIREYFLYKCEELNSNPNDEVEKRKKLLSCINGCTGQTKKKGV